jgi:hypothetical protein
MTENEVFWDVTPRRMVKVTGVAEQYIVFTFGVSLHGRKHGNNRIFIDTAVET